MNREGLYLLAVVSMIGQFRSLHIASRQPAVTEYTATGSGRYLGLNSLLEVITACLNVSQRNRVGAGRNMSTRRSNVNRYKWSLRLDIGLYEKFPRPPKRVIFLLH